MPLRVGRLELLSNTDFFRKYEWSQAICDPLENTDPEIAETEQTLKNRNIKTERQTITITLSKRDKVMEKGSSEKNTDEKSSVTERSIELTKRATLKNPIFPSLNQSLKMDYI